jgi:CubicO group peptidase (beta-lactamase class C family)
MLDRRVFLAALAGGIGGAPSFANAQSAPETKRKALRPVDPTTTSRRLEADPRVNRLLAPFREKHGLPGLIGALVVGEKIVAIGADGVRKLGADTPISVNDLVHLGSCTKAMTATLCGSLVDEKKLAWTSTIREIFPAQAKGLHTGYQSVTLLQLLNHRAGLPANGPWWDLGQSRSTTAQRRTLLTRILSKPPEYTPGTKMEYSNVGFALAGLMAEQVTSQPWETLMRERIFGPLAMTSAGFGAPGKVGGLDQPWGHNEDGGRFKPNQQDNAAALGPAGTVHATMSDWAKFGVLHLQAGRGKPKLLSASTFKVLHTPPKGGDYAGGWIVVERSWGGGYVLNHNGSNTSWYATIWLAPNRNFATLVATNQGGDVAAKATDEVTAALIGFHGSMRG